MSGSTIIALSDSGVLAMFAKPPFAQARASIRELPGGPGDPRWKVNRDSEALLRDPAGRGWWIAFENRDSIWLYDRAFTRAIDKIVLDEGAWPVNQGAEGLATDGKALLVVPESGDGLIRIESGAIRPVSISGRRSRASDAVIIPDGSVWVLERSFSASGFGNHLLRLRSDAGGYHAVQRIRLGVGRLDNLEAIAAEALPSGGTRFWLMSDDNGQSPLRTLLIVLDLPPSPSRAPKSSP